LLESEEDVSEEEGELELKKSQQAVQTTVDENNAEPKAAQK
jgi:hypothetical protein